MPTFTGGITAAPSHSDLDMLLMAEWEDRAEQGLFRYDVTECECKVVPGAYGFVAQLNEGRASKKRPTEFRIDQVCRRCWFAHPCLHQCFINNFYLHMRLALHAFDNTAPTFIGCNINEMVGLQHRLCLIMHIVV